MLPSPADYCTAFPWPKSAGIFQAGGGDSRWGSLAFPAPWKGIFFCPPVSGCSHLFIGVFNAPRHAVEVPTLLKKGPHSIKKGCHTLPAPSQYWFPPVSPLLFPFRRQMSRRSARLPPADYCTAFPWPKKAGIVQTGGGASRWGPVAFPAPWKGFFFSTGFRVLSPFHWCLQCPQPTVLQRFGSSKGVLILYGTGWFLYTSACC